MIFAVSACFFFIASLSIWNGMMQAKAIGEFRELVHETKTRITNMQDALYEEIERKNDE